MSGVKISQLPVANYMTAGDIIPVVFNGETRKLDASLITAIDIPKPELKIHHESIEQGYPRVKVFYYETGNNEWLKHTPELWLFKLRESKSKPKWSPVQQDDIKYYVPKKWVHTTNSSGTSSPVENSSGKIYGGDVESGWTYDTEWSIPSNWEPSKYLNGFDFKPLQFWHAFGQQAQNLSGSFPYALNNTTHSRMDIYPKGIKHRKMRGKHYFRFSFVIRDPNNPMRVLIGKPSDTIKAQTNAPESANLYYGLSLNTKNI